MNIRYLLMEAFGRPHEGLVVEDIRQAGKIVLSLVAERENLLVGHVLFTEVLIEPANPAWRGVGLAPIGVLPGYQKKGIGSALIAEGIDQCRDAGFTSAVVLGDPSYYQRHGFSPAGAFGLGNTYGADDAFMAMELVTGSLRNQKGIVWYQAEFESFATP